MSRCNVLLSLPWKNNYARKSDGTKVEMGASVRLQSYITIDRMFRAELRVSVDLFVLDIKPRMISCKN